MVRIDVVEASHRYVGAVVAPGDLAVDATAGNGGDTLFLCRAVGAAGRVLAIDIQESAVEATRRLLADQGMLDRCTVVRGSHIDLIEILDRQSKGTLPAAVMFNLGYLPGGDKTVTTDPDSTVLALGRSAEVLRPGGIVSIVVYRGHPGAVDEAEAVEEWLDGLDPNQFSVFRLGRDGVPPHRPYIAFVKSSSEDSHHPF